MDSAIDMDSAWDQRVDKNNGLAQAARNWAAQCQRVEGKLGAHPSASTLGAVRGQVDRQVGKHVQGCSSIGLLAVIEAATALLQNGLYTDGLTDIQMARIEDLTDLLIEAVEEFQA